MYVSCNLNLKKLEVATVTAPDGKLTWCNDNISDVGSGYTLWRNRVRLYTLRDGREQTRREKVRLIAVIIVKKFIIEIQKKVKFIFEKQKIKLTRRNQKNLFEKVLSL